MHFGPSSGEPCPFWLEPINPATLGKKASWVWKHGCQKSRRRLCTGKCRLLPCETREAGLKSHRGRQQSAVPQTFPRANGGTHSKEQGLTKHALARPAAPMHWHREGKGKERGEMFCGNGEGAVCTWWCLRNGLPAVCCALPPHHTLPNPLICLPTQQNCFYMDEDCPPLPRLLFFMPHGQGNIPPLSSGTTRDWA